MRVTRLEIFGFKSFLEKLTLPLEAGFTGVVGPNGCGKSNIVDAIRWILGETRASQLRGGTLEDVIFNGTDKLRPLGLAEVTLTLRSANQDFFSEIVGILTRQGNQFAAVLAEEQAIEQGELVEESSPSSLEGSEESEPSDEADGSAAPRFTVIDGRKDSDRGGEPGSIGDRGAPSPGSVGQQGFTVLDGGAGLDGEAGTAVDPQEITSMIAGVAPTDGEIGALSDELQNGSSEAANLEVGQLEDACDEEYARKAVARFGWLRNVQEVQVTRRLYRSGESEFFINRVACRLKDIKELFRLCGIGARAYTIVAQGEVGRIVTSRPEERRLIIEEAAGVAGFREKISAASRRLEETNQNLLRLDDIAKEVQRQVNSLRVQASRAKARQELKDRIVVIEERLFAGELCALEHSQVTRAKELDERRQQEQSAQASLERCVAEEQEARGASLAADLEGDDIRRRIDAITDELRRRSEVRAQCVARITEMSSKLSAAREQRDSQNERRGILVERKSESERTISDLERQEAELVHELGQLGGGFDELVRATSEELRSLRSKLAEQEQHFRNSRDALVSAKSRLETLQDQVEAHSPIAHMKDLLVEQAKRAGPGAATSVAPGGEGLKDLIESLSADARILVSTLTVPEELERAVHAALGARMAAVVVSDVSRVAVQCGELVTSDNSGSHSSNGSSSRKGAVGQFPSITALANARAASGDLVSQIPHELEVEGVQCPSLMSLLQVQAEQRELLEQLLRGVYVAPSTKVAARYFELAETRSSEAENTVTQLHGTPSTPAYFGAQFVTPQGELLKMGEYHYAGKVDSGALRLQREANQLSEEIKAFEARYEGAALIRSEIQEQIGEAERKHGEALAEARRHQVRARELANQQGAIRGRLQSERRVLAQIEQDIGRTENALNQFERDGETYAQQLAVREEELQRLDAAPDAAGESRDLNGELQELRSLWKGIEEQRSAQRDTLGKLAQRLQMARNELERVRASVSRAELEVEKVALERNAIEQRVVGEYGAPFFTERVMPMAQTLLPEGIAPTERAELVEEVQKIRARIAREGDVDTSSIQRFEEEQARLAELTMQREDLSSAARTLGRTIEMLRETSEKRFLTTFRAVRTNFSKLIPRLFGGGKASLELSDPSKPLESGIDISVRPPGKKLKSIELMSGGEKALCAIALIVAMFMERPSPLCVLDEVDAPLDEANLVRFLSLLKDMSNQTQFVVVTHNKQTMTVSDQLIGVTMQQPGASTVVTVSLQEAFRHVA